MALIVFSFPHGFPAARDIRKRSEVQHFSPLILSSLPHLSNTEVEEGRERMRKRNERKTAREKTEIKMRNTVEKEKSLTDFIHILVSDGGSVEILSFSKYLFHTVKGLHYTLKL